MNRLAGARRALAALAVGVGIAAASAAPAAHAQLPPPPPLTTPPIDIGVPGLDIEIHVPSQDLGGSSAPGVPGAPEVPGVPDTGSPGSLGTGSPGSLGTGSPGSLGTGSPGSLGTGTPGSLGTGTPSAPAAPATPSAPAAPGAPAAPESGGPGGSSTAGTDAPPPSAPGSAPGSVPPDAPAPGADATTPTTPPASAAPSGSGASQAAGEASSDDSGGGRGGGGGGGGSPTFGSAVAGAVTEPLTLVSALTLALGLGVVVGAAPYLPRYRRRQRELLEQWARASEHERAAAAKLAEADHQKSEFLALVSHELRTPLTAVKGFVDTVLLHWEQLPEERRRELLTRASSNADELGRLVSQLMEFARSDTGPIEIAPAELDVRAAVNGALHDLAPVMANHTVDVEIPDGLEVEADADAFNHVLVNLLTNAVKFSPAGSCVLVRACPTEDGSVVSVSDEGVGIPPEEQERIFDRFYQSSNGDHGRGTGIGLTIAQRFTALHGGRIWVESEPGQGATFSFTMPAVPVARAAH